MSAYIVISKHPKFPQQHVLKNGNMSPYGSPRRFMSKKLAREIAGEWAQHFEDAGQVNTKVAVRKVGG